MATHKREKDTDAAIRFLNQAIAWQPVNYRIYYGLSIALANTGHNARALKALKQAVELSPDDKLVHYQLGKLYQAGGDIPHTLLSMAKAGFPAYYRKVHGFEVLDIALQLGFDPTSVYREIGDRYWSSGKRWDALEAYWRSGDPEIMTSAIQKMMATPQPAVNSWRPTGSNTIVPNFQGDAETLSSARESLYALIMDFYLEHGDAEATLQWGGTAREDFPESPVLALFLGIAKVQYGEPTSAIEELQRASGLSTYKSDIFYWLGEAYTQMGRLEEASENYERAIELVPDYMPPYLALAQAYQGQGEADLARSVLQTALQIDPANNEARVLLKELGSSGQLTEERIDE